MDKSKINKILFIYLIQASGATYVTDDIGPAVQRRPLLGLQYLCAILEKMGIETNIFDQRVLQFDISWLIEKLKGYDLVGFYCADPQEDKVKNYCKKIKERLNIPILVGGPSTLENPSFLDYGCDIVVHGEGEITIKQIIKYYNGVMNLEDIKGISYKKDGGIISVALQEPIKNLDELPFPDRSKVDINSYYDYFLFSMRKPYITMVASRGCIYRCSFCTSYKLWGYRYRVRSVNNVLWEIDEVVRRYGVRYIAFQDDLFGITNDWIEEFCKLLLKRPYKIRWMAILHPFSVRNDTEKILKIMRKAGCDTLSFGLQSAHPEILKNVNRNPDEPEQLKKLLKIANKFNFVTYVMYIFGLPGDTRETINNTIEYSINCGSTLTTYNVLYTLRGSDIEKLYKNNKICELPQGELIRLSVYASKRFYTCPKTILRITYFIIKNPEWLFSVGINMPSILARAGLIKPRSINKELKLKV